MTGYACDAFTGCPGGGFDGTLSANLSANAAYAITLCTNFTLHNVSNGSHNQSGYGLADPFIYIDPGFANGGLYTLNLSPGISNAPASVPEPSTLAIAGLGLAAG